MKCLIAVLLALALTGCTSKSKPSIWVAVNQPLENFEVKCLGGPHPCSCDPIKIEGKPFTPFCSFSIEGFWRSTSGPGSELAFPDVVSITCTQSPDADEKKCIMLESTVNGGGKLESDSTYFPISLWTHDQIIATTIGGACDIGDQIVVDLKNKAVMRRMYPTKVADNKLCEGSFSETNSYVLHGGYWQLTPPAGKTFEEPKTN